MVNDLHDWPSQHVGWSTDRAVAGQKNRLLFIYMEAIPLRLLLNKPHLFSLTQHRLISIQLFTLT